MRNKADRSRLITAAAFLFATLALLLTSTAGPIGPIANAGLPQFAAVGATIRLDGSLSTSSTGAPLSYQWTLI